MLNDGMVTDIKSLYLLTVDKLLTLEKTKDKLASKIVDNIQNSKGADLITFLASFGINGAGKNKIEKIVNAGYTKLEDIFAISIEKLTEVDSFAEKSATEFKSNLKDLKSLVKDVAKIVKPLYIETVKNNIFKGKSFCITGTLSMKRSDLQNMVKENGGKVSSGVSAKLDYLITNDNEASSSKFKKAKELEVPIITEDEFFNLLNQ
jgi:DNA ligase (NAD+)